MKRGARSSSLNKGRSYKVIIAVIAIWSFLFVSRGRELHIEKPRAARTPLGLPRVGSNRAGSSGHIKNLDVKTFDLPSRLGCVKDSWQPRRKQNT